MTSPIDMMKAAIFGNPPQANWKPDRQGVLDAYTAVNTNADLALTNSASAVTTANATAATLSDSLQGIDLAAALQNMLTATPSALPYEVTGITGGIGTGTGGTPGWYVGGVSGGPLNFQWSYQIGSDGKLAAVQIDNPGIATANTAPTLSLPSGGMTSPTVPTATVGTVPVNRVFFAPTSDGLKLGAWMNSAGSLATVTVSGTQIAVPLAGYYGVRVVATYGDRALIPLGERQPGMLVKVTQAIDEGSGNYRALWFTLDAADLTNSGWKVAPEFALNWVAFTLPPIFDQGVMYFPGMYVLGYEGNGYGTFYAPSAGQTYAASQGSTGNNIRRHVFDKSLYTGSAGGMLEDCILEVDDSSLPLRDSNRYVVLAVTRNGRLIDTRDYTMVGDIPGGTVANSFAYGKQPDYAPWIYPGSVAADITDSDLIAMGFTRGVKGAPNTPVTYGNYEAEPFEVGDYIVVRFKLYAEADGVFGNPTIYIYTSEQAVNAPIIPVMFRQINSKVREYYYAGKLTAGGNGKWAVGSNNSANASRVWVVGAQFYRGSQPGYWISSSDFPDPVDCAPLMADQLWAVSDRKLPLFPANGMLDRALHVTAEIATTVVTDPDSGNTPLDAVPQAAQCYFDTVRNDGVIQLDPAHLSGESLTLTMRAEKALQSILTRVLPVNVRTVPLGSPTNIKIGYFGDSHSASYFVRYLKAYLNAWNIFPTFYGTLDNTIGDKSGETRQYGEGRGGWGIANFFGTYQLIGGAGSGNVWDTVLGPGSIAAYTGGDFTTRQRTNPFLNNGASGSSAPVITDALPLLGGGTATGFRFDLVNYRTRFSLPTDLDFVLWEIGGNDQSQVGGAAALTRIDALWPIALAEARRAWPDAHIIGWAGSTAVTNDADIRWTERRPLYASQINAVRDMVTAGDTKLHYVSTWMHHTVRSGYPLNVGAVDALTGATRTTLSDEVHTYWPSRQQSLEALSACIANLVGV